MPQRSRARTILILLLALAMANAAIFNVRALWLHPVRVASGSMEPELSAGDRLLVNRRVDVDDMRRGDIVVAELRVVDGRPSTEPGDGDTVHVVKRLIGLPGETIQGAEQVVAVNGTTRLDEPWAEWGDDESRFGPIELADDEVWLMGDARDASDDSRHFGPVNEADVMGRVSFRWWPLSEWGRI